MRRVSLLLMFFAVCALASSVAVSAPAPAAVAKKRCKMVVKTVHGKRKHVRVCHTVKPKPTPSPPAVPAAAKIVAQTSLPLSIDSLAVGDGAVWVTLDDKQRIVRIDPATLNVVATITNPLAAEWAPGIAVGAGAVWASNPIPSPGNSADAGALLRIDPATNTVAATISVGRSPEGIAFAGGAVWTANHRSDTPLGAPDPHLFSVSRVDPGSNREAGRIVVERRTSSDSDPWTHYCCGPQGMTAGAGSLWVGDTTPHTVYRIDPAGNAVVAAIENPNGDTCGGMAASDTAVWIASGCDFNAVWRIDSATNTVAGTVTVPGEARDVALGFGSAWATVGSTQRSPGEDVLVRVDAATNLVVGETKIGSPGPVAVGDGAIWVAAGSTLYKLQPA